jgi:hypothetical protein
MSDTVYLYDLSCRRRLIDSTIYFMLLYISFRKPISRDAVLLSLFDFSCHCLIDTTMSLLLVISLFPSHLRQIYSVVKPPLS